MRKLLLTLACAGALGVGAASTATAATPAVVQSPSAPVSGLRYDQKVVHARAGRIKIVFMNPSALKHNVNVEARREGARQDQDDLEGERPPSR